MCVSMHRPICLCVSVRVCVFVFVNVYICLCICVCASLLCMNMCVKRMSEALCLCVIYINLQYEEAKDVEGMERVCTRPG